MTDIVLARHGETTWHADHRYAGSSDVPLTPQGIAQADELAKWAAAAGLAALFSSDLSRTRRTARPCAAAAGLPLQVEPRLREVDFGRAEGMSHADLARDLPTEFSAFQRDPVADHLPGGEDPRRAAERGLAALADVAATYPDGRVLVVCHGTLIRIMLCVMLGVPPREYRRMFPVVRNGCLSEVRLEASAAREQPAGPWAALLAWNAPPALDELGS